MSNLNPQLTRLFNNILFQTSRGVILDNILKYFINRKIIKLNTKQILEITDYVGSDVILGLDSTNSVLTSKKKIKRYRNCKKLSKKRYPILFFKGWKNCVRHRN